MNTTDAYSLARTLMNEHGLGHWVFEFDRAKRRAGCCRHRRRTISLSEHYVKLNNEPDIRNTILHEIAHALAGYEHGHDQVWKDVCIRIGAKPERCYDSNVIVMPKGKYKAVCNGCNRDFYKHRKIRTKRYCLKCGPDKGSLNYILKSG